VSLKITTDWHDVQRSTYAGNNIHVRQVTQTHEKQF